MVTFRAPAGPFRAVLRPPGDKSLSHRALILAAMAPGESVVSGLGPGADVASTRRAVVSLGVVCDDDRIASPGIAGWIPPSAPIDAGNAGTTMRLLAGALAGTAFTTTLVGDRSLMQRPMARVAGPLRDLGAAVTLDQSGRPPLVVEGRPLRGTAIDLPVASAQVRTAVALAALQAEGATTIDSPPGYRDHTERWLAALGRGEMLGETCFRVLPGPVPVFDLKIPGDLSSAAFLLAAAALRPGASVTVTGVTLNPGRTGFLDVLATMGAVVTRPGTGTVLGDPVGDVTVVGAPLHGTHVSGELTGRAIDELPLVALLGSVAAGTTIVGDAAELRVKESDRIETTVAMVRALGGRARATEDGFEIDGVATLAGGPVATAGDHRVAMTAAVAATAATAPIAVTGYEAAAVSWPRFEETLEAVWSSQ